ncbi:zinc-binding dehydrogenase [Polyangium sp. 15x6]|uniref:zinc-binding dehydrogenase n=1 Tax=Polyangium sp. 15x6 TaxID=3042687 RepID=UPI00249BBEB9|nr:zinc-binding dehydrogenase [Polyangium sp. 15x6]MDI3283510.1 zinc-binding dehydrogenase [Polyangium sp. 15x6]
MLPKTYKKLIAVHPSRDFRAVAKIVDADLVSPGPGQVLVRNVVAGVNASDPNISASAYDAFKEASTRSSDIDLGAESAGEVVAVGPDVTSLKVGDLVMALVIGGGFREYLLAPVSACIPIPRATPEMLAILVNGLTASIGLKEVGHMGSGETVVVTAAAGGVGQFAVQLAKRAGNHVIGVCGTDEKREFLEKLGCDRVVNHRTEDLGEVLAREYPRGVDIAFESVGGALFDASLANLAIRGRLLVCGFISEYTRPEPASTTAPRVYHELLWKSAQIRGFFLFHFADRIAGHLAELLELSNAGALSVHVDPTPFEGLASCIDAVEHLHSGKNVGKVVVRIGAGPSSIRPQ